MRTKQLVFRLNSVVYTLLSIIACTWHAQAQLKPSKLFATGMILQREVPIPVWGTANAGDSVFVTFNSVIDTTVADNNGKWKVIFPALNAGGPYEMTLKCKTETLNYTDIYIGDLWLCSGQSNMEFMVSQANNAAANTAAANDVLIRQCKIPKGLSGTESEELPGATWTKAIPSSVGSFSAIAYYFAREMHTLQAYKDIPIGILNISYGGSRIEAWMSKEMLGYDENDVVLASGVAERQPTLAYNKMINPVKGVPIKGFLWYQGESNADYMEDAIVYGEQFKSLITQWRKIWNMGDLPFIWIQLPNQGTVNTESAPQAWDTWPQLRAAQTRNLALSNTGEVITIDVGEVDIHPKDKESVGKRLATAVRKVGYGEDIVYNGPRYKSHVLLPDGKVQISFDNIGSGLLAKDTTNGGLKWFTIAGIDGVLRKANAVIDGNTVIVSSSQVPNPTMVRYAWEYNPLGVNFYNKENLPAAPFKIDVVNSGFKINTFTSTSTKIERGQFITLNWKTSGNIVTTLNGEIVDSLSAIKLMPLDTTAYTLKIVSKSDLSKRDSITITVNVINPLPTIKLSTKMGNVSAPNETITILADAKAPGGGTVKQVEFYINDDLLIIDKEAPYEASWTPTQMGTYKIKALVINAIDDSAWAIPYSMFIYNLTKVRYEAETATLTGVGSVTASNAASNKKFMKLQEPFTLTFKNINVDTAGNYQVNIRYQMTFDPSKEQLLYVNGSLYKTIAFTAPDMVSWMDYSLTIPLKAGSNEIMIKNSWGWMSFDYIDVLGAVPTGIKTIKDNAGIKLIISSDTNAASMISYQLPKAGFVSLDIYDLTGKKISNIYTGKQTEGKYTFSVNKEKLKAGMYIAKLNLNNLVSSERFIVK